MLKKQSQVLLTVLFIIDLIIVGLCWNLAYFVRFSWLNTNIDLVFIHLPHVSHIPQYYEYYKVTPIILVIAAVCYVYGNMYNPKRVARYKAEFRSIIKAHIYLFIILTAITFYYRGYSYSRVQSAYFFVICIFSISIFRTIVRGTLTYLRNTGRNLRRILIVGDRQTAINFVSKVNQNKSLGFHIIGYIGREDAKEKMKETCRGDYRDIPEVIAGYSVDQVYIALDSNQQSDLEEINRYLAEQTVDLNIVPDIYHTLNINPEILDLDGMPIIAVRQSTVEGWNRVFKRAFDLAGATLAIILLIPVWLVIPILIKLSSKGPVFYVQERMGLDGKSFNMIKFRSMKLGAEDETGAVWAKKNDDRRTKLGIFMRKTSLDEVPQFFNVIAGSMSLVGPRPERPVFIEEFKHQIPNYMLRHKMKAGLTGWAQVNGWRGNTSLEKRIEFDIYYLTNWSIWFDLKIIVRTIFTGIFDPNAY